MSAAEEEVINLLRNKFFVVGLDDQLHKWSPSKILEIYHLLLSVLNSSYEQQYENEEKSIKHISRCLRLLGLGHLIVKPRTLVDFRKAPRIITSLEDKITAKYRSNTAQRIRSVIKSLENRKSGKIKSNKQVNGFEQQENEEPTTTSSKPTVPSSSEAGTIFTGRQIPRTPMRPLNAYNENSNVRQSLVLSPEKHTGQKGTVSKKQPTELKKDHSVEYESMLGEVVNVKEVNEVTIAPMGSKSSGKTSFCRQLSQTPDLLKRHHGVTLTEASFKTELHHTLVTSTTSFSNRVDTSSCSDNLKVLMSEDRPSIEEEYQESPPPYISPPEEFRDNSLPQCVLNGQKERNDKENFSIQSYSGDRVPPNMGTVDLSDIVNVPAVHHNEKSSEITSLSNEKCKRFVQAVRTENELIPQGTIALPEDIPLLLPKFSSHNTSWLSPTPQALSSSHRNNIPLGRQLDRTPPLIVNEQNLEISASCKNTPAKPESCKTPDLVSISSDISYDASPKPSLESTFFVSSEKEACDLHDSSVPEVRLTVQKSVNEVDLKRKDGEGTDNNVLQELPKSSVNLDGKNDLLHDRAVAEVIHNVQNSGSEGDFRGQDEDTDNVLQELPKSTVNLDDKNSLHNSSAVPEVRLNIQKSGNEEDDLRGQDKEDISNIVLHKFPKSTVNLHDKNDSLHESSIMTEAHKSGNEEGNLRGQDEEDINKTVLRELLNSTVELYDNDDSLHIFDNQKQKNQTKIKEFHKGSEGDMTVSKEHVSENSEEQVSGRDSIRRNSNFCEEKRFSILEEVPVLSASYSFHLGGESFSQSPKHISVLENSIPTGRQLCRTPPLCMIGKDPDTLVDSENLAEAANVTLESYNSVSSLLSEKATELKTDTDVELKTDGSHMEREITSAFIKENISQIMLKVDEDDSFEIFSKEKKTRKMEEKTENLGGSVAAVVPEDPGNVSKENLQNVDSVATTTAPEKWQDASEKNLKHAGGALEIMAPEEVGNESQVFPDKKATHLENRDTLRKMAIKKTVSNKRKGNRRMVCMEDDFETEWNSWNQSKKTSRQNAKTLEEKSNIIIEGAYEGKQACPKDNSLMNISSKTVKKSKQTKKTTNTQEEEFDHMLPKDLEGGGDEAYMVDEDESLEIFPEKRPIQSGIKNSSSKDTKKTVNKGKGKNKVCVEDSPGRDKEPNHQGQGMSRQESNLQGKELYDVLTKCIQEGEEACRAKCLSMEVCPEVDVENSKQTQTLRKSARSRKEEFHHKLPKDIHDSNEQVCGIEGNESLQVFLERNTCSRNGSSPSKVAVVKKAAPNKGLRKNQVCAEGDSETDKKPRNSQSKRIPRQTTKIQEENFMSTKGAQKDSQVGMTSDSLMKVCSDTAVKKTKCQTRKMQQQDAKEQGKESHHILTMGIQEHNEDWTSLVGMKNDDKCFTEVDKELSNERNHDALSTVRELRSRKKDNKTDAGFNSTGNKLSSDQSPNKVHMTTIRKTRSRGTKSVVPVISEKYQEFDGKENENEDRGMTKGRSLKVKDGAMVDRGSTTGGTGEVLFGKKERQHLDTASMCETITHEASNMDSHRQIRKRHAKIDKTNLEIPVAKTRGAKKRCLEKTDCNTKEVEGEYAHSQKDLQSPVADRKRRDNLKRGKKGEAMAINSPPSKIVNSSADGSDPNKDEARKKTSRGRARATRKAKSSGENTDEMMELNKHQHRKRPAKTTEPVEILESSRIMTNGSKHKKAIETRENIKPSGVKESKPLERKTRRTTRGSEGKDAAEASKTKKPSGRTATKSKNSSKKS